MQPFCSKVTSCVGASNVRLPSPSEINTITLPSELSLPVTKSWVTAGPGCSFAQLGSEFMLTLVGCGRVPVNFTLPTTDAPALASGRGAPAFAPAAPLAADALPAATSIASPALTAKNFCFVFIRVESSQGPEKAHSSPGQVLSGSNLSVAAVRERRRP